MWTDFFVRIYKAASTKQTIEFHSIVKPLQSARNIILPQMTQILLLLVVISNSLII